jgi:hypothetical protein
LLLAREWINDYHSSDDDFTGKKDENKRTEELRIRPTHADKERNF